MQQQQVDDAGEHSHDQRLLHTLEQLLALESVEVHLVLKQVANLVLDALEAEKVDLFLYDEATASLIAAGTSDTPLGAKQHALGLHIMAVANGGHSVDVFQTGRTYHIGQADADLNVPRGVREALGVRSIISVVLDVHGVRRGVLEVTSTQPDRFTVSDRHFLEAISRWVGVVMHRAELVEQLERAAASQARTTTAEELITVLAHDLQNYLTPLTGGIQLLRKRADQEGRTRDQRTLTAIERTAARLVQLVRDLMDVRRLDGDGLVLAVEPVDLVALVHDTLQLIVVDAERVHISAPTPVWVVADPSKVRQVLENLVWNALKHTPAQVAVSVEVQQEQRDDRLWGLIQVRDTGPGIAPEVLPQIFQRFTRGGASKGLGLGLYLARTITEAHGGTLTVETAVGVGTTFLLALPGAAVDERRAQGG